MADPVSMGLAAAGSVIQGIGGYKAGQQNKRALKAQSREELIAGNAEESRIRDAARASMGEQQAAQFGNGFLGGSGSALDALRESQINGALDALSVRREAQGKARQLRAQGKMAGTEGKFALAEGLLGAGSKVAGMNADWAAARSGTTPAGAYRKPTGVHYDPRTEF